jgi:hypothetical protein
MDISDAEKDARVLQAGLVAPRLLGERDGVRADESLSPHYFAIFNSWSAGLTPFLNPLKPYMVG